MNAVNDMGSCMFCTSHEEDTLSFTEVNSDLFYKKLKVREQEYLIPLIEEFKRKCHRLQPQKSETIFVI